VSHLERSVAELRAALTHGEPDPDYRAALGENLVVIAKYRARIACLDEEIAQLKRGCTVGANSVAIALQDGEQQEQEQPQQEQPQQQQAPESQTEQPSGDIQQLGNDGHAGMWL
jgi:ParB-like chromosome segregation protein Spo0J